METQSDICCFGVRPSEVNIVQVLLLLEHAQKCVDVFHLRNHGGLDAEGGRYERNGSRDDAQRAILPVPEVSHLCKGRSAAGQDPGGHRECEAIGSVLRERVS